MDLLGSVRLLVDEVHGHADELADEAGDEVVLLLRQPADPDEQGAVSERDEDRAAVGELSPGEGELDLRLDHELEHGGSALRAELDHLERVGGGPRRRAHLADGVGGVALLVVAPATDEVDELLGVVVLHLELVALEERDGEAEAVEGVADEVLAGPVREDVLDLGDQVLEPGGAVDTLVDVGGREGGDVQGGGRGQCDSKRY